MNVLKYLAGTKGMGLVWEKGTKTFEAFVDSDYAGDLDGRKSTFSGWMSPSSLEGRCCNMSTCMYTFDIWETCGDIPDSTSLWVTIQVC
jgi:hypothetical protein